MRRRDTYRQLQTQLQTQPEFEMGQVTLRGIRKSYGNVDC